MSSELIRDRRAVHRYYDPVTAQFTSVDPLVSKTGQPYSYAGGDPANETDPLGLCLSGLGFMCDAVHSTGNFLSDPSRWRAEANFWAGAGDFVASTVSLGHVRISAPYCGSDWAYGTGHVYGMVATSLLGVTEVDAAEAVAESPSVIAGFTNHGLEQVMGRDGGIGVSDAALNDAVMSPVEITPQAGGAMKYVGSNATVVLNSDGKVITAWATNSSGTR